MDHRTESSMLFKSREKTTRRSLTRRDVLIRGAALGGAATFAAHSSSFPVRAGVQQAPNEVVIAQPASPRTLDGGLNTVTVDRNIFAALYDTLLNWEWDGETGTIIPGLATDYSSTDDTTWRISLRQDVVWHDGSPFTADDVKFTIERSLNPDAGSPQLAFYSGIERVEVIDEHTVDFITAGQLPTLPVRLTLYPMIPMAYVTEVGDEAFANQPVGTGPFQFTDYLRDDHLTLTRFPDYWGDAPGFESVTFNFVPTPATRVAALRSGDVDVAVNFPPDSVQALAGDTAARAVSVPVARGMQIYIDAVHDSPLADARVRQALNLAVDRETLIAALLDGSGTPISSVIPPSFFGYDPAIAPYPYDPGTAAQLLADAGYSDGFRLILRHPNGFYPADSQIAEAVVGQLAAIGINAESQGSESAPFFTDILEHHQKENVEPTIFLGSWGAPVFDAGIPWNEIFGSGSVFKLWLNDEFNALVDEALITLDEDRRLELYHQAHRLHFDEAPAIFLWQVWDTFGVDSQLQWTPRPDQLVSPRDMSWS